METRANTFVVGVFVLGVLGALLGFIYWMRSDGSGSAGKAYHVIFDGSVQGLTDASPVLFNGIRFGAVQSIQLIPEDTRKVRVSIIVRQDMPVRTNSRARVATQGLAGFAALEITPGTPDASLLEKKEGEALPVIYADAAGSGSLFAGVADAAGNANALMVRLNALVSNNEDTIRHTLTNLEGFSGMLNEHKDDVAGFAADARALSSRLNQLSQKLENVVDRLAGEGSDNPNSIVSQAQQATSSVRQLAEKLDRALGDRADGLTQQAQRGLREFELFMKDARRLSDSLDRVVQKVERNPTGFLLGGQQTPKY